MNILIIILILFCGGSCEKIVDHAYYINVQNSTNDTVLCYDSYNYPDTLVSFDKPLLQTVTPQSYTKLISKKEWKGVLPKDTILIYFLSKDSVDKYSWDKIRSNYNILKRYDLSLDDLEKQNWTVTYP